MLRASSLPALAECPRFESGDTGYTDAGTDRHIALRKHFEGDDTMLDLLPDEDAEGVRWAADYIRVHAPASKQPLLWETETEVILEDYTRIPGTRDAVCGREIFDLKWRHSGYAPQMALYALSRIEELGGGEVSVHLLYACFKRAEVLRFDREAALRILEPIAARVTSPSALPTPCSYCGWCDKKIKCTALNERAHAVNAGREDWKLQQYHASEIKSPTEMAKAKALSRQLRAWCDAVDYHALQLAVKQGLTIPGFEVKTKAGRSSCADVLGAFQATGLPAPDFLACCDLRLSTAKDNPAKKGLTDAYAAAKGLSKAAATRELKAKLAPFMRTPKDVLYLKPINSTEED